MVDDIIAILVHGIVIFRSHTGQSNVVYAHSLGTCGLDIDTDKVQIAEISTALHLSGLGDGQIDIVPPIDQVNAADIPGSFLDIRLTGGRQLDLSARDQIHILDVQVQVQIAILISGGIQIGQQAGKHSTARSIHGLAGQPCAAHGSVGIGHIDIRAGPGLDGIHGIDHILVIGIDAGRRGRRTGAHAHIVHTQSILTLNQGVDTDKVHLGEVSTAIHLERLAHRQIKLIPTALLHIGQQIPAGLCLVGSAGAAQLDLATGQSIIITDIDPDVQIAVSECSHIQMIQRTGQDQCVTVFLIRINVALANGRAVGLQRRRGTAPRAQTFNGVNDKLALLIQMGLFLRLVVSQNDLIHTKHALFGHNAVHTHKVHILQVDLAAHAVGIGKG